MNDCRISLNPSWHGLRDGKMPPFPEQIVRGVLARAGLESAENIEPWPFGPFDILARFTVEHIQYVLKGRHIEQRGERSLFETQFIQSALLEKGVPVAPLWTGPDGKRLFKDADWKTEGELYYEVQQLLPGDNPSLDPDTAFRAGALLARFHRAGSEIDTFLLNKMYWIEDFTARKFAWLDRLQEQLSRLEVANESERGAIRKMIERHTNCSWRSSLSWGLIHGNVCCNNLLVEDGELATVDLDEVGLGELVCDLLALIAEVPEPGASLIGEIFRGYRAGGGVLRRDDLLAIRDELIFRDMQATPRRGADVGTADLLERYRRVEGLGGTD